MRSEDGRQEAPQKLQRFIKRLLDQGEEPVQVAPALLQSQATDRMLAIARMGMLDRVLGYLVTTKRSVHFVRPGILWDRVQTVPLEGIDGVEYVDEFHTNTLSLKVGGASERIVFYDERDGIWFYRYVKYRQWQA
ncbi:MAG: hypothetical protein QUS08_06490 [Methanothrix sp.]|nr:hypothetical protein [Methanothrix sp.]